MSERPTMREGDRVTLAGTVTRVQEGYQHADYAVIELEAEPSRPPQEYVVRVVTTGESDGKCVLPPGVGHGA